MAEQAQPKGKPGKNTSTVNRFKNNSDQRFNKGPVNNTVMCAEDNTPSTPKDIKKPGYKKTTSVPEGNI